MGTLFKNISIRIKILFAFTIVVLVFLSIGVSQYNTLKEIETQRVRVNVVSNSYFNFMETKFLLSNDYRIINQIFTVEKEEELNSLVKEHEKIKEQILAEFDKISEIYSTYYNNPSLVDFITILRDSSDVFTKSYKNNIILSSNKIIEFQSILLNPVKLEAQIKIQLNEEIYLNNFSNKDSINYHNDVLNELILTYNYELNRHKDYITLYFNSLIYSLTKMENSSQENISATFDDSKKLSETTNLQNIIVFILGIIVSLIITMIISKMIITPIEDLKQLTYKLAKGELPENNLEISNDEIGEMNLAINSLLNGLKQTSNFAYEIGKENFDHDYTPLSEKDVLGNSLLDMRKSLKFAKQEEEKRKIEDLQRSWTTEGLAQFAEILRHHTENIKELSNDIIINLVKYLKANQGGIFILNDSNKKDVHLELLAAYAYNRKKYLQKRINIGEGLIGSVAIEKYTIYMTDVPNEYIEIESGIGSSNPRCILIVPLKIEEEILGVIEMASFNEMQKYEINLVEKIAESIATTLSTARINTRTAELLEQSKKQAQEMQEQEEEMRQTIEQMRISYELSTINEEKLSKAYKEIEKNYKEIQNKEMFLNLENDKLKLDNKESQDIIIKKQKFNIDILENILDGVLIFDEQGNIEFFNKSAQKIWGYKNAEIIGRSISKLFVLSEHLKNNDNGEIDNLIKSITKNDGKEMQIMKANNEKTSVFVDVLQNELPEGVRYTLFVKDLTNLIQKDIEKTLIMEQIMAKEFRYTVRIEQLEDYIKSMGVSTPSENDITELIRWTEDYSINLHIIDKQHIRWVEIINKFYTLFKAGSATKMMDDIYKDLMDYSEYHFGFEEKYLTDFKYEDIKKHKFLHDEFLTTLKGYYNEHKNGKVDVAYQLMMYLKSWVKNHIQIHDKSYVECFKKNGLS